MGYRYCLLSIFYDVVDCIGVCRPDVGGFVAVFMMDGGRA